MGQTRKEVLETVSEKYSPDALNACERVSTGIPVLDELIDGGLPKGEMYVINGAPGTGKTILAMQFLAAGVEAGETTLCLALSQRVKSVRHTAASAGVLTGDIAFRDLSRVQDLQALAQQQTIFDNSAIELENTMAAFTKAIDEVQPQRVVFDGMSHLRMLADDPLMYCQQLFALRDYLNEKRITAILTATTQVGNNDHELVAIAHGAITLSLRTTAQGVDYRSLHITKIRSSCYQLGEHDMELSKSGIRLYPCYEGIDAKKDAEQTAEQTIDEVVLSGIEELDKMLCGGLQRGTSCAILGASGTGKTSISTLFARSYAQQNGKVAVFLFDELRGTFLKRSQSLDADVEPLIHSDQMRLYEISFGDMTPGKFADMALSAVEEWGAGMVVIDTLTGYFNAMPDQHRLLSRIHELLMSLNRRGVLTFVIVPQRSISDESAMSTAGVSYLADTVLLLCHFEFEGKMRQAISIYKKRYGGHERSVREVSLRASGVKIGAPLTQLTGVLSGAPRYTGTQAELIPLHD